MKIEKLETFTKKGVSDFFGEFPAPVSVVRLTTDTGEEGIGQISPYNADISAKVFHRQVAPVVLGEDPLNIEELVEKVTHSNYKFPWSYVNRALAGLDTALWDLKAKRNEMSVCELLGGTKSKLKPYGSSMRRDNEPQEEGSRMEKLANEYGFEAFKVRVGTWDGIGNNKEPWEGRSEMVVSKVREAIGRDRKLFVDANSSYTPKRAVQFGKEILEPNDVAFFEEPVPYWDYEATTDVRNALELNIAGGEQINNLPEWNRLVQDTPIDILQPDVCYMGGISNTLKVMEAGENMGITIVPHASNKSLVTVFTMHLLCAKGYDEWLELTIEDDWASNMLNYDFPVEDGYIELPNGPGWGVKLNPEWLATSNYSVSEI